MTRWPLEGSGRPPGAGGSGGCSFGSSHSSVGFTCRKPTGFSRRGEGKSNHCEIDADTSQPRRTLQKRPHGASGTSSRERKWIPLPEAPLEFSSHTQGSKGNADDRVRLQRNEARMFSPGRGQGAGRESQAPGVTLLKVRDPPRD